MPGISFGGNGGHGVDLKARGASLLQAGADKLRDGLAWMKAEARLILDRPSWTAATTLRDRLEAVSWLRASVVVGLTFAVMGSLWIAFRPRGIQAHPPRLPTEQEWRANREAAKAMEATLSPALAAANRPETPRTR